MSDSTAPMGNLVERTACSIYLAEHAGQENFPVFELLDPPTLAKYERMAIGALRVALSEPVTEPTA